MACSKLIAAIGFVAVAGALMPPTAAAQQRRRAVPRGSVRVVRPPVVVAPYRNYYYRGYRPTVNLGFFYGRPGYFGSYGRPFYRYGYRPYGYPAYGYPGYASPYGYAPWGYGYGGYSGRPYGGIRIDLPQRDAEVFADGYFVGTVNDFDGVFQQANLEAGPHRIEIRAAGFETITFDVNIEPGRTITYRSSLRPLP